MLDFQSMESLSTNNLGTLPSTRDPGAGRESISICMATYNGEKYLRDQIESILPQLKPGDELLISDDGSRDATEIILNQYKNVATIVATRRLGGVVRNFSRALSYAKCPYIVLCDQDDVWLPNHLESIRKSLSEADLVLTNAFIVDETLQKTGLTLFAETSASPGFWRNLSRRSSFVGCCMGFRRRILEVALPLPAWTPWHDWLLGLLASVQGKVTMNETPTILYRRHANNASQTGSASSNSLSKKFWLRIRIFLALLYCLQRNLIRQTLGSPARDSK